MSTCLCTAIPKAIIKHPVRLCATGATVIGIAVAIIGALALAGMMPGIGATAALSLVSCGALFAGITASLFVVNLILGMRRSRQVETLGTAEVSNIKTFSEELSIKIAELEQNYQIKELEDLENETLVAFLKDADNTLLDTGVNAFVAAKSDEAYLFYYRKRDPKHDRIDKYFIVYSPHENSHHQFYKADINQPWSKDNIEEEGFYKGEKGLQGLHKLLEYYCLNSSRATED